MTLRVLMLLWIALSAAGLAAAGWMLFRAWNHEPCPARTRPPLRPFRAPG